MTERTLDGAAVLAGLGRVANALEAQHETLTTLDQALGDGDLGITAHKIAQELTTLSAGPVPDDLGKFLAATGMAVNKVASSTMGTLVATALMRAGKEVKGRSELDDDALAVMFRAAVAGVVERGKANLGDKTALDALHPASEAFGAALAEGAGRAAAVDRMVAAAQAGLESVTASQSRIGRASWQGERTAGCVDPGCAAVVIALQALAH
jgi:phosphoenolpyruvate---glycerone phosphotransferase subunit DhaL